MTDATKEELITLMLKENKTITKHLEIGLTRLIILWKISKGDIYGYNLMKIIDEFYRDQIELGLVKKANPSKIYPILKKMEENELIKGEWELKNNKNVKVYKITEKGNHLIEALKDKIATTSLNPKWQEFIHDMTSKVEK